VESNFPPAFFYIKVATNKNCSNTLSIAMKSFFTMLLVALLVAGITYFVVKGTDQGPRPNEDKVLTTESDFRDRIAELRMQKDKHARSIKRLEVKKKETLDFLLNEKGIKSSKDIKDDADTSIKYALRQLKGWKSEIDKLQSDLPKYDEAIDSIKAMLAEIERRRISDEVALTEEDYVALRKIVVDLNERLEIDKSDPFEDQELAEMLDAEILASDSDKSDE